MREKPFEKISIKEIAETAGVGRATWFRNYSEKKEALTFKLVISWRRWAEEHDQMVISEWPTTPDGAYRYWEQRIWRLYNTIKGRPNYLWGFVKDELNVSEADMLRYFGPQPELPEDFVP